MLCPVCQHVQLVMADRQGIEIDYCPQCRGVWLDRGELDKIIERSSQGMGAAPPRQAAPPPPQHYPQQGYQQQQGYYQKPPKHYKKKKSLLGELFDFDFD